MVQTEKVDKQFIADLVGKTSFNETLLAKDYYITRILYLLKDIKGIYFKGGTALQKIFLNHSRISEDIDFTLKKSVSEIRKEITQIIHSSKLFGTNPFNPLYCGISDFGVRTYRTYFWIVWSVSKKIFTVFLHIPTNRHATYNC
ncbi:MAG: nucleotidyl transferase AbiEii/AbiGii toxin family protein [Candidatus Woesearchaeota archaeon]